MKFIATLIALAPLAVAASAADFVTSGTLAANDPTYNRLSGPASLSTEGTAVHYDAYSFTVSVTGTYSAEALTTGASPFDPYLFVYRAFAPSSPIVGLVNADDDFSGSLPILGTTSPSIVTGSKIVAGDSTNYNSAGLPLTAGAVYVAVVTSFNNGATGDYRLGIGGGPGDVTPVPEPATMAALALGAAATLRRRKRA